MFNNITFLNPLKNYYGADQYKEPQRSNVIERMRPMKATDCNCGAQRLPDVDLTDLGGIDIEPTQIFRASLSSLPPTKLNTVAGISMLSQDLDTQIANFKYAETLKEQNPANRNLPDEFINDTNELTNRYLQRKLRDNKAKDLETIKRHSEMMGHDIPEDELKRQLERADIQRLISDPKYKAQVMESLKEDGFTRQAKKIQQALSQDFTAGRQTQQALNMEMKNIKGLFEQMVQAQQNKPDDIPTAQGVETVPVALATRDVQQLINAINLSSSTGENSLETFDKNTIVRAILLLRNEGYKPFISAPAKKDKETLKRELSEAIQQIRDQQAGTAKGSGSASS